jgi:hypothetical protein
MFGKLFGKNRADQTPGEKQEKLSGPKDVLQPVGQSLVVSHRMEPDWVWDLKNVTRSFSDNPNKIEFRVYEQREASMRGVTVKNFHSLDDHPELILYSGSLNKKTRDLDLVDHKEAHEKAV